MMARLSGLGNLKGKVTMGRLMPAGESPGLKISLP